LLGHERTRPGATVRTVPLRVDPITGETMARRARAKYFDDKPP
jgi:hypothetical protein